MFASILLFVLFVAGLFTTNLHTKKFFAWFIAFTIKNSSNYARSTEEKPMEKSTPPIVINSKKDEIIKRVFATFDKNSDGFITKQELRISLKNIGMSMEEKEIEEMIKNVDRNGDGLIDINEFRDSFETLLDRGEVSNEDGKDEGMNNKHDQEDHDEVEKKRDLLQEAFDVFDEDKDGLITVEELGLVLSSMGFQEACKLEDCKKMIKNVDIDGDGMVNFDEFKMMMGIGQGFMPLSN